MARGTRNGVSSTPTDQNGSGSDAGPDSGVGNTPIFTAGTEFIIDPASIGSDSGSDTGSSGDNSSEPVRKRRGRKPGSTNKKGNAPLRVEGIELVLLSTHQMLAALTHAPMLALDQEEARQLATATVNVARHYDVSATEKTVDWIALMMALGTVYGPRIVMMNMARKEAKRKQKEEVPVNGSGLPTSAPFVHVPSGAH